MVADKNAIRSDIYSVKVRGNGCEQLRYERMFRNSEVAKRYARGLQLFSGYRLQAKIVHPAQWVVDGYCAAGNVID
jgi:hypothetical protein